MQQELLDLEPSVPVSVIGINAHDKTTTESFVAERTLPWLQDTEEADVWDAWGIKYRDILIVDEQNFPIQAFNLTEYNLTEEQHYQHVLQELLDEANL